jgi:hypothetical protein
MTRREKRRYEVREVLDARCEEGKGHVRGTDLMLCTRFRKKARNLSGQLSWRENEENTGRTERVRHCRLSALVGI